MAGSPRYLELLEQAKDLHIRKNAGYAGVDNPDPWANFRMAEGFGVSPLQGCFVRMSDKYIRVQNLLKNPANDQVGESIKDTLFDLSAYALIAICLLEESEATAHEQMIAFQHVQADYASGKIDLVQALTLLGIDRAQQYVDEIADALADRKEQPSA